MSTKSTSSIDIEVQSPRSIELLDFNKRDSDAGNPILDGIRGVATMVGYSMGIRSKVEANEALGWRLKAGYGVGDMAGNLMYTIIEFWLLFYFTDVVGILPAVAGVAILIGKIFDAVADPLVGWLSDRTHTKWGRRRPWMLMGALPLAISSFLLFFNVMETWDPWSTFFWATFVYIFATVANTAVNIPYCALTPELSSNFNERTSLTSYRMAFAAISTLIGAALTLEVVGLMPTRSSGFMLAGALFGIIMMITTLISFASTTEKLFPSVDESNPLRQYWAIMSQNKPYLILLIVWILVNLAITIVTSIMPYYFRYVHLDEDKMSIAVADMIVTALLTIPLTNYASKRYGKTLVYAIGLFLFTFATMCVFFFGHTISVPVLKEWDANFYFILGMMVIAGFGFSTQYVLPWAMIPDTISFDYANTGIRREGVYYAVWNFTITAAAAVAAAMVGAILGAFGYVPDEPTELSNLGIRLLMGPFTAVFTIAAIIGVKCCLILLTHTVLYWYPMNSKMYEETKKRIEDRDARNAQVVE